jgi:hypothetical protein
MQGDSWMNVLAGKRFPNATISWGCRKAGQGFRGYVRTVERSGWLTPCVWSVRSKVVRVSRADALADAERAAVVAAETGYVPEF